MKMNLMGMITIKKLKNTLMGITIKMKTMSILRLQIRLNLTKNKTNLIRLW